MRKAVGGLVGSAALLALLVFGRPAPGTTAAPPARPAPPDVRVQVTQSPAPASPRPGDAPDPDLEPGFPVQTDEEAGTYYGGPALHTLVGPLDGGPGQAIIVTALANGPLYAWNAHGTPVPGWPLPSLHGPGYAALGTLRAGLPGLQVFASYFISDKLAAYSGAGALLPGWPQLRSGNLHSPAALADVDGDGLDEIFVSEYDFNVLHAYRADGTPLPGWPYSDPLVRNPGDTPAIGDLDGDGVPEIVTCTGGVDFGLDCYAFHANGTLLPGWPIYFSGTHFNQTYPVIGDVDGDGVPEVIIPYNGPGAAWVAVVAPDGTPKRTLIASGTMNEEGAAPALADLDGDGIPEILLLTINAIDVWHGDGTSPPGWPRTNTGVAVGNSALVVGDVDGDGQPDIVVSSGDVRAYDRFGNLLPRFPKILPMGLGSVPAIADIDGDGRNEIIVTSTYWGGAGGMYNRVWAFDLHGAGAYGCIPWGQLGGSPRHQGHYPVSATTCAAGPTPTPATPTATATPCAAGQFRDVHATDYFYTPVQYLVSHNVISGYGDCTFRPYTPTTRAQLVKIVVLGFALPIYTPAPISYTFRDVPPSFPFYAYIETAAHAQLIGGYACGADLEPCDAYQRPYFRPYANVTRAQLAKITVLGAAWPLRTPTAGTFTDVVAGSGFYPLIETAVCHGILSGYGCGGPGEPCDAQRRPYFRQGTPATRGQIAKIVYLGLTAGNTCATPTVLR